MTKHSARARQLAALGLLLLIVLIAAGLLLLPLIAGFSARAEQRALLRQTYARNLGLIAMTPSLRRRAERQRQLLARLAVPARTAAFASDSLRERLRTAFGTAGGDVTGLQDVAAGPASVRASVEGHLTLPQLDALLDQLGNTPPYLVVESLTIAADRALESGRLDLMDVRIEASIAYTNATS